MTDDENKPDEAVSPMEAQNTGPAHVTPAGAPERQNAPSPSAEAAELAKNAVPPGGEPAVRDDR